MTAAPKTFLEQVEEAEAIAGIRIPQKWRTTIDPKQWGHWNINPDTPLMETQTTTALIYCFTRYEAEGITGRTLFRSFQDDFSEWTTGMFKSVMANVLKHYQVYLVDHGVQIARDRPSRTAQPERLAEIIANEDFHFWTNEEIDAQKEVSPTFQELAKNEKFLRDIQKQTRSPSPAAKPTKEPSPSNTSTPQQQPAIVINDDDSSTGTPLAHYKQDPSYNLDEDLALARSMSNQLGNKVPPGNYQTRSPQPTSENKDPKAASPQQLASLEKMYKEEMKYTGGIYDVFADKFLVFRDKCRKVGITPDQYGSAFSTMLSGNARKYYYKNLCDPEDDAPVEITIKKLRAHFETDELHRTYLSEWREISFIDICHQNPGKTKTEALEILFDRLRTLQGALGETHEGDRVLRDQALQACQGIEECKLCLYQPAATFEKVCGQLRSAILVSSGKSNARQYLTTETEQYWVDRTYNGNGKAMRFGQGHRGRPNHRGGRFGRGGGNRPQQPTRHKKCYVCNKDYCWSTKHTLEERNSAYERYKRSGEAKGTSREAFAVYLAEYEGQEGDTALTPDDTYDEDEWEEAEINFDLDIEDKDIPNTFHAALTGPSDPLDGRAIARTLNDQAALHAITKTNPMEQALNQETRDLTEIFTAEGRYSSAVFQGIMPDCGAAGCSTAGHQQTIALRKIDPSIEIDEVAAGQATIRFGDGPPFKSLGTVTVKTPFGPVCFHVVPANTPFLMALPDMDRMGVRFDNIANCLIQGDNKVVVPIVRKWGHPWMLLHNNERGMAYNHLTEAELRQIHRRFGHPSVQRLYTILQRAGSEVDLKAIEHLTQRCHQCQMFSRPPNRFKFKVRDDYEFNYEIVVDVMYLDGNLPVLHVVDVATAFQSGRFLADISARTTWEALRLCWIDVYQGPPDKIVTDAGKNFVATEFKQNARTMAIEVVSVPIEAHNSIGKAERYHEAIRRAYSIIRKETTDVSKEAALQMAFKAINDSAGPDGIIPTLLVFGAYPRISDESPPSPTATARAEAIRKATAEIRALYAKRTIADALAARNGPDTVPTRQLPLQSEVRVWREGKGWRGPFRLVSNDNNECVVDTPAGHKTFRITAVKPYYRGDPPSLQLDETNRHEAEPTTRAVQHADNDTIVVATTPLPRRPRGRPRKAIANINELAADMLPEVEMPDNADALIYISAKEEADMALAITLRKEGKIVTPGPPFEASTAKEIDSLIERGVFEFTTYDPHLHKSTRIFKSRIVNEIKGKGAEPYEKSRLVIQGYADDGKEAILTQAPTIQRSSQRLILALAPSLIAYHDQGVWLRDITQAYTQSTTPLNREILAHLPQQIRHRYPPNTIMKVVKPLYGIAEAGTHWYATYSRHHKEKLEMVTSTYDPCLLISAPTNKYFAMIGMQTDDTIGLSGTRFSKQEEEELRKATFTAKGKQTLTEGEPLIFNGGIVSLTNGEILLTQKGQGRRLAIIDVKSPMAKKQYVEQRARGAYIASICQPEACFDLSTAAQNKDPTEAQIKALNQRIQWQLESLDRGLTFSSLDLSNARLMVFVDGSFANNADLTSQLGFVIILANETTHDDSFTAKGNIVHFSSTKSKRVTRSVLASEVYGMVAGVDMAYAIATTLKQVNDHLGYPLAPTIVCTDSYSLYECLVKLGTTKEKRLMIDIMALRQSYERREIMEIRWINGNDNPADGLTKASPNGALKRLIEEGKVTVQMEGWVTRA